MDKADYIEERRAKLNALVEAVYRITASLPQEEVLRTRLRSEALSLVSHFEHMNSVEPERYEHFVASVQTLVSFLAIARSQKWVSDKNFHILKKAFFDFRNLFEAPDKINDTEAPFSASRATALGPKPSLVPEGVGEGECRRSLAAGAKEPPVLARDDRERRRKNNLTPRQKKLLTYFEENQIAQIADLASIFPDLSRRTIRRDLDKLMQASFIEKDGKTNGAQYVLVKPHIFSV